MKSLYKDKKGEASLEKDGDGLRVRGSEGRNGEDDSKRRQHRHATHDDLLERTMGDW